MANIELVININEETYKNIKAEPSRIDLYRALDVNKAIVSGTPLNDVLDEISAEFISRYPKNYAGEPELGGASCMFSLNKVLEIINKYNSRKRGGINDRRDF